MKCEVHVIPFHIDEIDEVQFSPNGYSQSKVKMQNSESFGCIFATLSPVSFGIDIMLYAFGLGAVVIWHYFIFRIYQTKRKIRSCDSEPIAHTLDQDIDMIDLLVAEYYGNAYIEMHNPQLNPECFTRTCATPSTKSFGINITCHVFGAVLHHYHHYFNFCQYLRQIYKNMKTRIFNAVSVSHCSSFTAPKILLSLLQTLGILSEMDKLSKRRDCMFTLHITKHRHTKHFPRFFIELNGVLIEIVLAYPQEKMKVRGQSLEKKASHRVS